MGYQEEKKGCLEDKLYFGATVGGIWLFSLSLNVSHVAVKASNMGHLVWVIDTGFMN